MNFFKNYAILVACVFGFVAHLDAKGPEAPANIPASSNTGWRAACVRPTAQTDMQVNNVRARLLTGGDIWSTAAYIVPKPVANQLPVSALYAGGVWIGGVDRANNIKLAAVTYRSEGFDFFSGPLDLNGTTELETCEDWDRFFKVSGTSIRNHINRVLQAQQTGVALDCDSIPDDILYWPGQGNPNWRFRYNFELPDQTLGAFWDNDGDNIYNPCNGDFPTIEIRSCEPIDIFKARELVPDEMVFWIYNDNGAAQTLSGPSSIQMEVQVQSFAYATNDEINDMSFYRFKLINKASEDLVDCYFSMWIDPDLGCYQDDYIGCDVERSMAYVYNQDATDGINGSQCGSVPTYGENVPILGMDYFRGPRGPKVFRRDNNGVPILVPVYDEKGNQIFNPDGTPKLVRELLDPPPNSGAQDTLVELGMTSFTYAENCGIGSPPPVTCDPPRGREEGFYNYIRGYWADGTPFTFGGTGYNPGSTDSIKFAFPSTPNDANGWSMCAVNMPFGDRRTLQATGPLLLQPGATNELIMGIVFVPDITYPCPDITRLRFADDIAQALFDNCFDITDGPDAPDLTAIELDQELILLLSNESTSNNFNEEYEELDLQAPQNVDNTYKFEGYRVYQLANASVTAQELGDVTKARQVAQVDVKNGIKEIYNWSGQPNPIIENGPIVWTPTRRVIGGDVGVRTSFRITEDQFAATENRRLVNHKQYHYLVVAYAYNNWKPFDITEGEGQRRAYLEGRGNIGGPDNKAYTLVPRPIIYEQLNAAYGDGPIVNRISGEGNPGIFLDMDETMYELILNKTNGGKILYKPGAGPVNAKVVDPLRIKDGIYRIEIVGSFDNNRTVCAFGNNTIWRLTDVTNNRVLLDNRLLSDVKEYILNNLGFSITIANVDEPGIDKQGNNGAIGATLNYKDENGSRWFNAVKDGGVYQVNAETAVSFAGLDFVRDNFTLDPLARLSRMGDGFFVPKLSTKFEAQEFPPLYLSPAARELMSFVTSTNNNLLRFRDLNNVDIVFTSDKTKWSKCIVVETAFGDYTTNGFATIDNTKNFEVRRTESIDQNGNKIGDGTYGFSYFPGYAVDVETGKRLNIFFGENSVYSGDNAYMLEGQNPIGGDLIYNPSSQLVNDSLLNNYAAQSIAGGQHYIYVTRQEYDECKSLEVKLRKGSSTINRAKGVAAITWTAFPLGVASQPMLPLQNGLIPNDLTVKLRVNNPYGQSRRYNIDRERECETDGDNPVYEIEFRGTEAGLVDTNEEFVGALANVNVVPNPYYAYSAYETSQFTNVIKITNLPERAVVTIYSLDGSFVKQYKRDERGRILSGVNRPTSTSQIYPDLEWDMKNFKDIPVASGVYLIHILAPDYGEERTIKWFGIGRKFDPNGL